MAVLSGLISVALLIYLVLRIARLAGVTQTVISSSSSSGFYDNRPQLPDRTEGEVAALLESMPRAWVRYEGSTPPLDLYIRATNEELYRRFMRTYMETSGLQKLADAMPMAEKMEFFKLQLPEINSHAYVMDWRGAQYPNGKSLPFAPAHMAAMMRQDDMLRIFVTEEAGKLESRIR